MAFFGKVDGGPPLWCAVLTAQTTEVWVGPIAGWAEHGPVVAWLGHAGEFIGYIEPDERSKCWVGSDPEALWESARAFAAARGLEVPEVPAEYRRSPSERGRAAAPGA